MQLAQAVVAGDADIAIATTGYAEPPMPGVPPYAYICTLWKGRPILRRVDGPYLNRESMISYVVEEALRILQECLEAE